MIRHAIGAIVLSAVLGFVAYLSPGHHGTDVGGGIAAGFIVFLLVFVGPRGFTEDS